MKRMERIKNSLIRLSKIILSQEGWEAPSGRRQSWRRKLDKGGYEYRYQDPKKDSKGVSTETKQDGIQIPEITTRVPQSLAPSLKAKEDNIRYNDFETLVCFDENGNTVFDLSGDKDNVQFRGHESKIKGNWLTHNHPRSTSFSREDILILQKFEGKGIRVVSKEYDYELCLLPDYSLSFDQTKSLLESINSSIRERFEELIFSGELSIPDANANHQHVLLETFARLAKGVFYARKPHSK